MALPPHSHQQSFRLGGLPDILQDLIGCRAAWVSATLSVGAIVRSCRRCGFQV